MFTTPLKVNVKAESHLLKVHPHLVGDLLNDLGQGQQVAGVDRLGRWDLQQFKYVRVLPHDPVLCYL